MNQYFLNFIFLLISCFAFGQHDETPWQLIDDDDDMQIYYRSIEGTEFKELKLLFSSTAQPKDWVKAISNVKTMPDWSYTCRSTYIVKQPNENEVYFYYIADVPWPITGRDVVLHMQVYQDSVSKEYSISSGNHVGLVPENDEYIRTDYMKAHWKFTQDSKKETNIEYFISMKLSNNFPEWLITKAITYSPIKSIEALKEIVE